MLQMATADWPDTDKGLVADLFALIYPTEASWHASKGRAILGGAPADLARVIPDATLADALLPHLLPVAPNGATVMPLCHSQSHALRRAETRWRLLDLHRVRR